MSLVSMVHGSTWWKLLRRLQVEANGAPDTKVKAWVVFFWGGSGWMATGSKHIFFLYIYIHVYTHIYIYCTVHVPLSTIINHYHLFAFQFWVPWQCWTSGWIGWCPGSKAVKAPASARLPNFKHSKPTMALVSSLLETNGILNHIYILNQIYIYMI